MACDVSPVAMFIFYKVEQRTCDASYKYKHWHTNRDANTNQIKQKRKWTMVITNIRLHKAQMVPPHKFFAKLFLLLQSNSSTEPFHCGCTSDKIKADIRGSFKRQFVCHFLCVWRLDTLDLKSSLISQDK